MKVTALQHTDVRGKQLNYLRLTTETQELLLNVGEKTYNTVLEMTVKEMQATDEELLNEIQTKKQKK